MMTNETNQLMKNQEENIKVLGVAYAAQKYGKLPYFDPIIFRVSRPAIDVCSTIQHLDHANLKNENIVYSSGSLLECIRQHESSIQFFSEAEIATYPTRFLSQELARFLCQWFTISSCLIQNNLANSRVLVRGKAKIYDLKSDHFLEWQPGDRVAKVLGMQLYNVEEDIAGAVSYYFDLGSTKPILTTQQLKKLIELGDRYGYDYVSHDIQGGEIDSKTQKLYSYVLFIKYEARYLDAAFEVEDKLYHISPLSKRDDILKYGLQPRSKTFMGGYSVKHKDRIYLFNGYAKDAMQSFVNKIEKQEYSHKDKKMVDVQEFALFVIDRKKIPSLKLYQDNIFQLDDPKHPLALYTYSNIPPQAIKFCGTVKPVKIWKE